ncbi:MAG: DUF2520 domain-containing protein [Candidatus Kapabacteria bacterium]|jgi:predicted short-subunit dehydrogenase-like oxidoreductase (DUF2520 family)|nr:DUF2520 domain-containing protein [Candidatus Kapabacteria bacterium]
MQSFSVIGLGKLGLSIAVGLSTQGRLAWTMNRGQEQRNAAKFQLSPSLPMYSSIANIPKPNSCMILAIADNAIEEVSEAVAAHFGSALNDLVIVHCSGAKNRSALAACEAQGAITMSLHPYQTFSIATAKNFKDIVWGAEYPPIEPFRTIAEQFAQDMVYTLGGKLVQLTPKTLEHKPIYHASAVFAANYLNALVGLAAQTAQEAGIDPNEFLPQILRRALENSLAGLKQIGTGKFPLTGPISRGDTATLREHLAHFRSAPDSADITRPYCHLGIATAEFACKQGLITAAQRQEMIQLFEEELRSIA